MKVPKMKDPPPPENSMAQANGNYDKSRDDRDVDKAFNEWVVKNNINWGVLPLYTVTKIATDIKAFAKFFAQRCGVLDGNSEIQNNQECDHPYHSVVGGNGRPERCLKCGKVLSD